jgi:hypothetical protein
MRTFLSILLIGLSLVTATALAGPVDPIGPLIPIELPKPNDDGSRF